jgi:hypothetical protein
MVQQNKFIATERQQTVHSCHSGRNPSLYVQSPIPMRPHPAFGHPLPVGEGPREYFRRPFEQSPYQPLLRPDQFRVDVRAAQRDLAGILENVDVEIPGHRFEVKGFVRFWRRQGLHPFDKCAVIPRNAVLP